MAASSYGRPAIGSENATATATNVRSGGKAEMAGRWTGVGGNAATVTEMVCQIASTGGRMTPSAVDVTVTMTGFQTA
jgi:hypothetical protein